MKKLLLALLLLTLTGCGTIGIGTLVTGTLSAAASGVVYWINGEAVKYYDCDAETINQAAQQAFKQMELPVKNDTAKKQGFNIVAGDKDRFTVNIVQVQNNITKVKVRVNFLGDKNYVYLFYQHLDDQINVIEFPNHSI